MEAAPFQGTDLTIEYTDPYGKESRRLVTVHRMFEKRGHAYIEGYCHQRRAPRKFRMDRITAFITKDGEVIDAQQMLEPYLSGLSSAEPPMKAKAVRGAAAVEGGFIDKSIDNIRAAVLMFLIVLALVKTETWAMFWIVFISATVALLWFSEWLKAKLVR